MSLLLFFYSLEPFPNDNFTSFSFYGQFFLKVMLSAFIVKGFLSSTGTEFQALPASTLLIFSDKTAASCDVIYSPFLEQLLMTNILTLK